MRSPSNLPPHPRGVTPKGHPPRVRRFSFKVKAVIFDMDGVITNTMPEHFRVWKTIFARCGIHVTHLDIYSREGQKGIMSVNEIFKEYKKSISLQDAREMLKEKEELFKRVVKRRYITGSRGFLKFLHARDILLALVTGTSRHELRKILPDSIYKLFSVIVTGTDVKNGKPHPEPFQKALKLLRLKPREAVVIENAPFGIQSAK